GGSAPRGGAEVAPLGDDRRPGIAQADQAGRGGGRTAKLPVGPVRPETERAALGLVGRRRCKPPIRERAQDGEIEVEVRGGGGLRGLLGSSALERAEQKGDEEQAREGNGTRGEEAKRRRGDLDCSGASGEPAEAVGRRLLGGPGVRAHHRVPATASADRPFASRQGPRRATAHPSCCSSAARRTSISWQCPDHAGALSVHASRSREACAPPRTCASHCSNRSSVAVFLRAASPQRARAAGEGGGGAGSAGRAAWDGGGEPPSRRESSSGTFGSNAFAHRGSPAGNAVVAGKDAPERSGSPVCGFTGKSQTSH